MKLPILGLILGFVLTLGARWALRPELPAIAAAEGPAPVQVVELEVPASPDPQETRPQRAPDLQAMDDLIAHFYGEPTGWDDPELQRQARERIEAGADAFEATGQGEVLEVDCSGYPCLATVELTGDEAKAAMAEHLDDLQTSAAWPRETPDGRVWRRVLEQPVEDVDPLDPYLQMRKLDQTVRWQASERVDPDSEAARTPIVIPGSGGAPR